MRTIQGNLLDIETGVICHQVNCQRVAGSGLALQIRTRWPGWFIEYQRNPPRLGSVHFYQLNKPRILIASLYAQLNYGTWARQTNYEAFYTCLETLRHNVRDDQTIYFPHGIGCGLAGGNWRIISTMIDEVLPDAIIVRREK